MNSLKTFLTLSVFTLLIIIAKCAVTTVEEAVLSKLGLTQHKLLEHVKREWTKEEIKKWHSLLQTMDTEKGVQIEFWTKFDAGDISLPDLGFDATGAVPLWDKLYDAEKRLFLVAVRKALDEIDNGPTEQEKAVLTKLGLYTREKLVALVPKVYPKASMKEWYAFLQTKPTYLDTVYHTAWDAIVTWGDPSLSELNSGENSLPELNSEEKTIFLVVLEKAIEEVLENLALEKLSLTGERLGWLLERVWTRQGVKFWYKVLSWLDYDERRLFLARLGSELDEIIAVKELGLTMNNLIAAVKDVGVSEVEKLLNIPEATVPAWWLITLLNGTAKTDKGETVNLFKNLIQSHLGWESDIFRWQEKFERDIKFAAEVAKEEELFAEYGQLVPYYEDYVCC